MLQRLTEELEYTELLDKAAACETSTEQMCYVAAFTTSSYSTTATRTGKPFNPLLGETFEFDRTEDLGWRSLAEQVIWYLFTGLQIIFFLKGHIICLTKLPFWSDKTKMRSDIILQYCLIREPANLALEGKKKCLDIMSNHSWDFIGH